MLCLSAWHCLNLKNQTIKIKTIAAIALGSMTLFSAAFAGAEKISPDLLRVLEQTGEPIPVIVMMKGVSLIPQTMAIQLHAQDVENMIKQRALQLQASMREYVQEMAGSPGVMDSGAPMRRTKFFWNVNALMATASPEVIAEMADRDDVQKIILDRRIVLDRDYREVEELDGSAFTYGLEKIGVPELRGKHSDLTGKGVTVGIIDTGLDASHPEFKGKEVLFKDFLNNKTEPYDDNGHGTHVAGTISGIGAGGTQIGIAPAVKLVIGKVFTASGSGSLSAILRAMEWIADPSGKEANGKNRPQVVNNSWGGGMGEDVKDDPFYQATLTWVQLEIFPCFAAGNSGPSASTVGSPGGLPPAFAVGATDSEDEAASFSSRGPVSLTVDGKKLNYVKPDVAAPGVKVLSSMPGGKYGTMSGTSMATPHTTGAIALLYQAKPGLKIAQVREILSKTAQHLGEDGKNNTFGAGRINVAASVDQMEELGLTSF